MISDKKLYYIDQIVIGWGFDEEDDDDNNMKVRDNYISREDAVAKIGEEKLKTMEQIVKDNPGFQVHYRYEVCDPAGRIVVLYSP